MTDEPYLWDHGEPIDEDVERLEKTLQPLRYTPRPLSFRRAVPPWRRLAIAAVVALAAGAAWLLVGGEPDGFDVEPVAGVATIDKVPVRPSSRLAVGSWIETAADGAVVVQVADIGSVTVHGDTRLGLLASKAGTEQRMQLDHGRIEALITAPPRLFFVDTPAAVAVDLGCMYELAVDEAGEGLLEVSLGWVALETGGDAVTVPMNASCRLYTHGPGIPWFNDATPAFTAALAPLDLPTVLDTARPRDSLTLWHLLQRVDDATRAAVIARMTELVGMPPGVTVEGVATLDRSMLDAWWADIELDW